MLHRQEDEGLVVVSQPAHAWLAGQIAAHWGNADFAPQPEEVRLAAALHDIGFVPWEQEPTFDPATGLPHSFLDLPAAIQLPLWTGSIQQLLGYGRYSALLVSMHFTMLAQRMARDRDGEDVKLAQRFLDAQEEFQTTMLTSLRNDAYYAPLSDDGHVLAAQRFVALADWLSLQILLRFKDKKVAKDQQSRPSAERFDLAPLNAAGTEVQLKPWPFEGDSLELVCEGKRLRSSFKDESAMREGLRNAAPVTLVITLRKGG